jgi:hypothetical protein
MRTRRLPWWVDLAVCVLGTAVVILTAVTSPALALAIGAACWAVPTAWEWKR